MKLLKKINTESEDTLNAINITPLTDCMMVLLIIFMITGSAISQTGFNISLPKVSHQETSEQAALTVSVTKDGIYYVNAFEVSQQNLTEYIRDNKSSSNLVVIEADSQAAYFKVMTAIDAAKKAGVEQVSLSAEIRENTD